MRKVLLGLTLLTSLAFSAKPVIDFSKISIIENDKDAYMEYIYSKNLKKPDLMKMFAEPTKNKENLYLNAIAYDYYYNDSEGAAQFYDKLLDLEGKEKINTKTKIKVIDGLLRHDISNVKRLQYKLKISECLSSFKNRKECLYYKHVMTGIDNNKYPSKIDGYYSDYREQIDYLRDYFNEVR